MSGEGTDDGEEVDGGDDGEMLWMGLLGSNTGLVALTTELVGLYMGLVGADGSLRDVALAASSAVGLAGKRLVVFEARRCLSREWVDREAWKGGAMECEWKGGGEKRRGGTVGDMTYGGTVREGGMDIQGFHCLLVVLPLWALRPFWPFLLFLSGMSSEMSLGLQADEDDVRAATRRCSVETKTDGDGEFHGGEQLAGALCELPGPSVQTQGLFVDRKRPTLQLRPFWAACHGHGP